jgi:hypothetical protein
MNTIKQQILARIKKAGRGTVFTPGYFLDIGSRAVVDKTLSRLTAQGLIRRITRGVYDCPQKHAQIGDLSPNLYQVAQAIANNNGASLQVSGALALHLLGLSTQVPAQLVYYTDGRSRTVLIGKQKLGFKHAGTKIMAGAGKKAGVVLQAIRQLDASGCSLAIVNKIAGQLNKQDKKMLIKFICYAPDWSRSALQKILGDEINV